jgi:L-ascorbate metabolism protein UlaG (beta-lactamase superfamily)/protein-tyrosine-phosphatase
MNALRQELLGHVTALPGGPGATIAWLGQAGFLIRQGGLTIVIDPYLSDSLAEKYRGKAFPHIRMMAPPVEPGELTGIDWVLCTHGHTDHMDPGTLPALLAANPGARVAVPRTEIDRAVERGVPRERLVAVDAGEAIELGGVLCTATPSAHETLARSEAGYPFLGYVLSGGGTTLWHSGDTIPFAGLVEWLVPFQVDVALLPVNGKDAERASNGVPGNLTLEEAVALTDAIGARAMIGHHFGLFDFNTLDVADGRARLARLDPRADIRLAELGCSYSIEPLIRKPVAILLVCRGNICRSPTADGILRQLLPDIRIDSAAIMDWNVGKPPHPDTIAVATRRGIDLSGLVARQITITDFDEFDLVLAMDDENLVALEALRPASSKAQLGRLTSYTDPGLSRPIPDPWGQERAAFESVYDEIEQACLRLAAFLDRARRHQHT